MKSDRSIGNPLIEITVENDARSIPISTKVLYFTVGRIRNYEVNPLIYEKALKIISRYRRAYTLSSLKDLPLIRVFRDYLWRIGVDPTKMRPSHEALIRRAVRTGEFPRVNTIVDIGNLMSIKHMIPVGIYDLDKITPPLVFRLSIDDEVFYPIGSNVAKTLPQGLLVLSDQEKIIHIFPHRDSKFSAVDLKTNRILVIIYGVDGIPDTLMYNVYNDFKIYFEKYLLDE